MNNGFRKGFLAIFVLGVLLSVSGIAQDLSSAERVMVKEGKLIALVGKEEVAVEAEVSLPFNILVKPDATYTVKEGKARPLQEGESLDRQGRLNYPDGRTVPVYDHIAKKKGRVFVMQEGNYQELRQTMTFPDGTVLQPDGTARLQGRRKMTLIDGQLITLSGSIIPTVDTISLRQGQVKVQKNGTLIPVRARGSLMMDDGTKVFGDGRVLKKDGTLLQLKEGQVIKVEGVQQQLR